MAIDTIWLCNCICVAAAKRGQKDFCQVMIKTVTLVENYGISVTYGADAEELISTILPIYIILL